MPTVNCFKCHLNDELAVHLAPLENQSAVTNTALSICLQLEKFAQYNQILMNNFEKLIHFSQIEKMKLNC